MARGRGLARSGLPLLLGVIGPQQLYAQQSTSLQLTEAWSASLGQGVAVTNLAFRAGHGIAALTGSRVVVVAGGRARPIGEFDLLRVVGLAFRDSTVSLVDARTRRVLEAGLEGRLSRWYSLQLDALLEPVSAALTSCGWGVALRGGGVRIFDMEGQLTAAYDLGFEGTGATATGNWLVLSESTTPFRVVAIDCRLPAQRLSFRTWGEDANQDLWLALPAFVSGPFLLQTRTDPKSDRRRFLVFDLATGEFLRETSLVAPMALVAGGCAGEVVGLRNLGDVEVIVFEAEPLASGAAGCGPVGPA